MNFIRSILFALLIWNGWLNAQTFTNSTGGAIPDNNSQTCFPLTVSGIGSINNANGLVSVCVNITHPYDGDLEIILKAPDGTLVSLSLNNGGAGNNYTNTCFTSTATTSIFSFNANPPFTGSFQPEGTLANVNNGQNADGIWYLCIKDDFAGDAGTLLNFNLTFGILPPTIQDCPAAKPICKNVYNESAAYGGTGNIPNEIDTSISCLKEGEIGDVWYTFTVQSPGFLNFTITPNVISEDYDWAVYNLTNATCADISTNPAISVSCNYSGTTGITGPTGGSALNSQSATGTPFNAKIPVLTGETYVINVSHYSSSTSNGYQIDFGASTATIFDNVPPAIKTITPQNTCFTNKLDVIFSENILCSTVQNTDFTITGPGGPYTVSAVSSTSCSSGATYGNTFTLTISPAMSTGGSYQLCLVPGNGISDLCGNVAAAGCKNFSMVTPTVPTFSAVASFCNGTTAPVLPLVSTNGISGTWNPATVSNSATNTYTFTPNPGQCATPTTLTVTVIPCPKFGEFASAPYITKCSSNSTSSTFYNTTGSGVNTIGSLPFVGANFGTFIQNSGTLKINGGEVKTFKNPALANVCGCTIFYTVYSGLRPAIPVFSPIPLPFYSNCSGGFFTDPIGGPCTTGDQKWQKINANIDLTTRPPGTYTLELYIEINGDNNSTNLCRDYAFANNVGANYLSNFVIIAPTTISYPVNPMCTSLATQNVSLTGITGGTFTTNPSTGLSINNANGTITPNTSTPGTYTVTYHYNDANGCVDSASTIVTIAKTSASSTTIAICPVQLPYTWNGNVYITGGTYKDTLLNSVGCDSVTTLVLNVKPVTTSSTTIAVCPVQLPYTWNGNVYITGGTYKDTLLNSVGCDSVATLVLTVKAVSASTTNIDVCPAQLPYNWNGTAYNIAGTFTKTFVNSVGCDSVATLVLSVKAVSASSTSVAVCPAQLPYNWSGTPYNIAGSYTKTFVNSVGCDSVATLVLSVKAVSASSTSVAVCPAQLPYNWNGTAYNIAGSYAKTFVNSFGCDSVATLVLSVKAVSASTTNIDVCPAQLPYNWNGTPYNIAGTFTKTFVNSVGCDSVATLVLSIKTVSTSSTAVAVCPTQLPYNWNGTAYNIAGSYTKTFVNSVGCDSVATLVLGIKAVSASSITVDVCPTQLPYNWNGTAYNIAGTFTKTFVNSVGCDSVATLVLSIKTVSASTVNIDVCPAQLPYTWNGTAYNIAGSYTKTFVNSVGCDSVATLVLSVKAVSASTTNIDVCPAQLPYNWNGTAYNIAGTFTKTFVNSVGCDSVATLVLGIKVTSSSTTNIDVCPAQLPYTWNGTPYNIAGTFTKTFVNSVGCDSVATLVLSIKTVSTSSTAVAVCPTQLPYNWNGTAYNIAGSYTKTFVNSVGCDSVATLVLSVKAVSASTTNIDVCPTQLPYNWNGTAYNIAGTFTKTFVNSVGCDSVATLVLSIKTVSASTVSIDVCPAQLPYTWNGTAYNIAGSYTKTFVNSVGCDSVATLVLSVKAVSASTTNIDVCPAQLPYNWNGTVYNIAGSYAKTFVNSVGCDSVATLFLSVQATSTSSTTVTVCPAQLPYTWNGTAYNIAGSYTKTFVNSVGCDSVATLFLSVQATSTSSTTVTVCPAQLPYNWNGTAYNIAGTFTKTFVNSAGCDSIATLVLSVKAVSASSTAVAVCPAQLPYTWNGTAYNIAGSYTKTFVNSVGCDSIATLVLSLKAVSASTTNIDVCPAQLPYNWNGTAYNTGGSYTKKFVNSVGCDSVATLVLSVKAVTTSSTAVAVCPAQLPYTWNGTAYNIGGSYTKTFVNSAGCDSVATLILSVKSVSTSTTNIDVCPAQLPYTWNGTPYNIAGTFTKTFVNSVGCDSVATLVLSIKTVSASTTSIDVCPTQLPYNWNGTAYNTAGSYTKTFVNSVGCDSVATLVLGIKVTSSSTTNIDVCPAQLPYNWNGTAYNIAGSYTKTFVNSVGCDSVATLFLSVQATSTSSTTVTVCPAQLPYNWNGTAYNIAGTFTKTFVNSAGCDSIATLVLSVKAVSASSTAVAVCPAQLPYTWNGTAYNIAGSYTKTFVNSVGCDSVATLVLSVKATSTSSTTVTVCPAQLPYNWNGTAYNIAGTFTKTFVNSVGCDSIATLVLSVKAVSASSTSVAVCPAQLPYTWNGAAYNIAGSYTKTFVNSVGCDSVATLILSVQATSTSSTTVTVCPAQLPYTWNGTAYNIAGSYTKTFVNSVGCDSVATLFLSVQATSTSSTTVTVCPAQLPYTWNGTAYNIAGSYTKTFINSVGCDSVATLVLSVKVVSGSTTSIDVCLSQLPYNWNGTAYNTAGSYTKTFVNSAGCDSVATLVLSVKTGSASSTAVAVCPAQLPYTWNGTAYNIAGTFTKTFVNSVGCDSVATLVLSIKTVSASTTSIDVCPTQLPYNWNGTAYNTAGSYTKTFVNSVGCDSVATLVLGIKVTSSSTTNIDVCPAQLPYNWNGTAYNIAGTFTKTFVNSVGCDSVATLVLSIKTVSASTVSIDVCPAQLPYTWNGTAYNIAGSYTKTFVNSVGCDSVATLVLSVKAVSASTTNIDVCPAQLPYNWNGTAYNIAGSYTKTFVNSVGCDSIAKLVLGIKATSSSTTNIDVCPAQLPYTWNGTVYNIAGSYTKTFVNSVGCDSVATLILSIKTVTASSTAVAVCPAQLPYNWNGTAYNIAGSYTKTFVNSVGCDSVATLVLSVKAVGASSTSVAVCPAQLPYNWNGTAYNIAGTFTKTFVNSVGCDSIAKLILSVKATSSSTTNIAVCPTQLPYNWNGTAYNIASSYTKTFVNSVGCDSIATLVLSLKAVSASTTNIDVCPAQLPYNWNGTAYNTGGSYTKKFVNSVGCDSVATLVLSVKAVTTSSTAVAVCPAQLPYTWNGTAYNIGGSYTKTFVNSAGCDSVATLILSVKSVSTSTTNIDVCPAQLPYTWNGTPYNIAGTFTKTFVNSVGCDSVATLVLSIKTVSASTTSIDVCPTQLPYNWNGTAYNTAGSYTKTFVNSVGCDSVATLVLGIKVTSSSTTNIDVCPAQLPYNWNGTAYNIAGSYTKTFVNSVGCDSVATLFLSVQATSTSSTTVTVCPAQLPYNWNGTAYNIAGTFTKTFVNSAGCDSIATLVLSVKAVSASSTAVAVCPAQLPYTWNGTAYNIAGSYTKTFVNSVGCDSVATLVLSVKATSTSSTTVTVCPAQLPYNWNGTAYNIAGTFTKTFVNSAGCDSIATLVLSVKAVSASSTAVAVCPAQLPYTWNGTAYNIAGSYTKTFVNSVGCDSVATLVLSVKAVSASSTSVAVCPAQLPYTWNGTAYNTGGSYTKTFVNSVGCDSVATLALSVNAVSASSTSVAVCPAQLPYNWNGTAYNIAGTFTKTFVNSVGCDSVATLVLSIVNILTSSNSITICSNQAPFSWNGNSYSQSGTYQAKLKSIAGCDSVATLILTISPLLTSVTNKTICSAQLPFSWNNINCNAAGTYSLKLLSTNGCDSIATLILAFNNTPSTPVLASNSPVCSGKTLLLFANSTNGVVYKWATPNGQTITNQNPVLNNVSNAEAGLYNVTAFANGCISQVAATNVTIIATPIVSAGADIQLYEGDTATLQPTVTGGSNFQYKWSPDLYFISPDTTKNALIFGMEEIQYSLTVTTGGLCPSSDVVVVKVLPRLKPIFIPNVFSPNNDGKNDVWIIKELAPYPGATVDVYTRYGQIVFSSIGGYKHPWDGTYKGNPIPAGTYYYIISTNKKNKPLNGWVTILR